LINIDHYILEADKEGGGAGVVLSAVDFSEAVVFYLLAQ
jgi:hypothetical protein